MLNNTEYTSTLLSEKTYQIDVLFNDEPISFIVVVANDESEIDELVQFRLNEIANPPVAQELAPSSTADFQSVLEELNAKVDAQAAEIAALKSN